MKKQINRGWFAMQTFFDRYNFNPALARYLGAEEEHWTVDRETGLFVLGSTLVFPDPDCAETKLRGYGRLKPDLPRHQLEVTTDVCFDPGRLEDELMYNRRILVGLGYVHGFTTDTRPTPWQPFPVEVYPKERYLKILEEKGEKDLRAAWIIGLHLHYGLKDLDTGMFLLNELRPLLPMFLAIAARSPSYLGRNRGFSCERYFIYLRGRGVFHTPSTSDLISHVDRL